MKLQEKLPFEKLMAYADGSLPAEELVLVEVYINEDREAHELVDGLKAIYKQEQLDCLSVSQEFHDVERGIEKKIHLHANFSNHLIELNRQLRAAAAVFVLVFSCSFLMGAASYEQVDQVQKEQPGPYDLALGSKVAP